MYEFDFLKTIENQIKIYGDFPLPVVICNKNWRVYWSNDLAKQYYSHITTSEGLAQMLEEFDRDALIRQSLTTGNCTIQQIFPFSSVNMSITPLMKDGMGISGGEENLIGMVLMAIRMDNLIDAKTFYQSTRMAEALSDSIRSVVSEVFSILDVASVKSDLMSAGWIKSGFNSIAYNSYRILRIASNISEYSRYQSGIMDLRTLPVNLGNLLREAGETIDLLARPMGIAVDLDLPQGDVYVNLDMARFETAFYNVLHNALYYTRKGNRVQICLRQNAKKKSATLSVKDKGLGIPAEVLPDVTRPYYVFTHGGFAHGIGLGLTIAKLAAEAHDGALAIRSEEGEGTEVALSLPVKENLRSAPLAQHVDHHPRDRFSTVYTGLADAIISPFHTKDDEGAD